MMFEQKNKNSFIQKDNRLDSNFQNNAYQQQQNEIELKPKFYDKQELTLINIQLEQQITRMKNLKQNHKPQQFIDLIYNLKNVIQQMINSKAIQQQQKKKYCWDRLCQVISSKEQNTKQKLNQPLLEGEGQFSVFNNLSDSEKLNHLGTLLNGYIKTIEFSANLLDYLSIQVENLQQLQDQKNQYIEQLNEKDQQINKLNQKDLLINQLNKQIEQYQMKLQQQYQNVDEFEQELNTFQRYHNALNEDYQQSQMKNQSLENQLKELQDKNLSLVLNCKQTIEHNQILINENNNLRSQILALQVQFAQVRDLKIEICQQSDQSDLQLLKNNMEFGKNKENFMKDKQDQTFKKKLVSNHLETQSTEDENSQPSLTQNLITNGY